MEESSPRATLRARKTKRTRVAAACKQCQHRKIRCTGGRPICEACTERGLTEKECVYQDNSANQRRVAGAGFLLHLTLAHPCLRSYIEQLEKRVRELERPRNDQAPGSATSASTSPKNSIGETHPLIATTSVPGALDEYQNFPEIRDTDTHDNTQLQPDEAQFVDAIVNSQAARATDYDGGPGLRRAILQDAPPPHDAGTHAIGSSTNGATSNSPGSYHRDDQSDSSSYFDQLRNMLDAREPVGVGKALFAQPGKTSQSWSELRHTSQIDYFLPLRNTADHLLHIYWNEVHPFFPFIHRPSFQAQYDLLWERDAYPCARMFHCMLNTVFALSCQLNPSLPPDARESAAALYFGRAKQLSQFNVFESETIEDVQALLLMGQYLQNTKEPARCWNVVGSAIRTAQGLRLHQEGACTPASTQRDREMFRRIWHGCLMMDRIVSFSLGLPAMVWSLSDQPVPLPLPVDDEYLSTEAHVQKFQPTSHPSKHHFFKHALILSDIMMDITSEFYGTAIDRGCAKEAARQSPKQPQHIAIVAYENRLNAFWGSLPAHLRPSNSSHRLSENGDDRLFAYQAAVLRARFLYTRILLFRPTLAHFGHQVRVQGLKDLDGGEVTVEQSASLHAAVVCIKSAQEVISLILEMLGHYANILPAFSNPAIFMHSAATVLAAARQCPAILAKVGGEGSLDQAWQQAMVVLERSESPSMSARQWVESLQQLVNKTSTEQQTEGPDKPMLSEQPLITQQPFGADGPGAAIPAFPDEFAFHNNDLMVLEDLDWNFLESAPMGLL